MARGRVEKRADNTITESEAMSWLQMIDALTADDAGISEPHVLAQFKNILLLQTHELFLARQLWRSQHKDFIFPLINKILKQGIQLGIFSPLTGTDSEKLLRLEIEQLLEHRLAIIRTALMTIANLEKEMFMTFDVILHPKHIDYALQNLKIALTENLALVLRGKSFSIDLDGLAEELWGDLELQLFELEAVNLPFIMDSSIQQMEACKRLDVIDMELPQQLAPYRNEFTTLLTDYVAFHDKLIAVVATTTEKISKYIPELTPADFTEHYQTAFKSMQQKYNMLIVMNNFLFELYMQQVRYPKFQTLANNILAICLPKASWLFRHKSIEQTNGSAVFTKANLITQAMSLEVPPLSVQQKLFQAYKNLKKEAPAQPRGAISMTEWGQFKTKVEYTSKCKQLFPIQKENLDPERVNDQRKMAEINFWLELQSAKDLIHIITLLKVAAPYFQTSSTSMFNLFSSQWQGMTSIALNRAFDLLKTQSLVLHKESPHKAVIFCQGWRDHSLFSRSASTQKKIDTWVTRLKHLPVDTQTPKSVHKPHRRP